MKETELGEWDEKQQTTEYVVTARPCPLTAVDGMPLCVEFPDSEGECDDDGRACIGGGQWVDLSSAKPL